ncbi:MAG TPA: cohesin domain-containing protein, partial [Candidatus Kryptonia bacterium]
MVRTLEYMTLLLLLAACSSAAMAQVRLSIPDTSGVSGNKITVPVYVDSSLTGLGVKSYQIQLSYNSTYMSLDSVISIGTLSQTLGSVSYNGTTPGIIKIAAAGTTALTGTGVLIYIRFRLLNSGYISLSFSGGSASNYFNEGTPAIVTTNGSVNIAAPPTINVSPTSGLLTVGDQEQFTAYNGTAPYHWSLTNPSVASIDSNGLLSATHMGFTKVVPRDFNGTIDTINGVVEIRAFRLYVRDTSFIQGQTFNLPVYSTDLTGLNVTSGSFQVQFNQNILTPTGVVQTGSLLSSYPAVAFNNSSSGLLNLSFAGSTPLSGSGVLVYLQFKVSKINTGGTTISPGAITFNESLLGNSSNGNFQTINLAILNITPSTASMVAGDSLLFSASGGTPPYTWTSSDSTLASIRNSGYLTAIKGGTVTVQAIDTYGGSGVSGAIQIYDARVSIADTTDVIGDTVDVPVYVSALSSGKHVQSLQATVTFDSSVVHAIGVVSAGTNSSGWTYSVNISGTQVILAGAGTTSLTGPGVVCKLRFFVPSYVSLGRSSGLNVSQFLFNEGNPRVLPVNGIVTASQVTAPAAPTLSSPANGSTGIPTNPTMTWNASAGATSYRLQVSTDSTFATTTYDTSGVAATSKGI